MPAAVAGEHRIVTAAEVAALAEPREDLPELVDHFVQTISRRLGIKPPAVPDGALDALRRRRWTGNIRELANAIERALIVSRTGQLPVESLAHTEAEAHPARPLQRSEAPLAPAPGVRSTFPRAQPLDPSIDEASLNLDVLERLTIQRALQATGGHRSRAAHLLGISERTLRNKLKLV